MARSVPANDGVAGNVGEVSTTDGTGFNRRCFLLNALQLPLASGLAFSLISCGARDTLNCLQADVMNPAHMLARKSRDYVEHSPHANKSCSNCRLFGSAGEDQCGVCTVDSLPANPSGYCSLWDG